MQLLRFSNSAPFPYLAAAGILLAESCPVAADEGLTLVAATVLEHRISSRKAGGSSSFEISGESNLGLESHPVSPLLYHTQALGPDAWWFAEYSSDRRRGAALVQTRRKLFDVIPITIGLKTRTRLGLDELQLGAGRFLVNADGLKLGVQGGIYVVNYQIDIRTQLPEYDLHNKGVAGTVFAGVAARKQTGPHTLMFDAVYSPLTINGSQTSFLESRLAYSRTFDGNLGAGIGRFYRDIHIRRHSADSSRDSQYKLNGYFFFASYRW